MIVAKKNTAQRKVRHFKVVQDVVSTTIWNFTTSFSTSERLEYNLNINDGVCRHEQGILFIFNHNANYAMNEQNCNAQIPNILHPAGIRNRHVLLPRRRRWPLPRYIHYIYNGLRYLHTLVRERLRSTMNVLISNH
jgi:hypothetical protein